MSAALDDTEATTARGKGTRRSWPGGEKRRIVEEAFRPGASVADVARRYGLNANQVFNWRRRALAAAKTRSRSAALVPRGEVSAAPATAFLPIGTIGQTNDEAASLVSPPAVAAAGAEHLDHLTAPRPAPTGSTGLIEIDLTCGTRLRVDAFVNERALRRVLSVLKAAS